MTYYTDYNQFADACDIPKGHIDQRPNQEAIRLALTLVDEEWNKETLPELYKYLREPSRENLVEVADGIVDTIYVLCQLARSVGIDLDRHWDEVQRANMRKVEGGVRKREDGKVLKPEGWQPPNHLEILFKHSDELARKEGTFGAENWPGSGTKEIIRKHQGE